MYSIEISIHIKIHVNPTNTFKVAFHFHRRATVVQTLRRMVHVYIRNDPLPTTDCAYAYAYARVNIETILYHTDLTLSPAVTFSY